MLNEILSNPLVHSLLYGALAIIALTIALIISSGVRLNKGAGVNGPLVFVAFGFVIDAIAASLVALGYYGSEPFNVWCQVATLLAQLIKLAGFGWWCFVLKGLVK